MVAGEGAPLLLLHGIAGSADEFLSVLPDLGRRYRAIAADAPGHGFSEKPLAHRYDIAAYVDATLGLMDTLGIDRAPVVAFSGAGTVAISLALTHPERVEELVLVDAG